MNFIKNMKTAPRLIAGFTVVALLAVAVGVVGITGMDRISKSYAESYAKQTMPLPDISKTIENTEFLSVLIRNVILYSDNVEKLSIYTKELNEAFAVLEGHIDACDVAIVLPEMRTLFDEARKEYTGTYKPGLEEIIGSAQNESEPSVLLAKLEKLSASQDTMVNNFTQCMELMVLSAAQSNSENLSYAGSVERNMLIVIAAAVVLALLLGIVLARTISMPLKRVVMLMDQVRTTGNLKTPPDIRDDLNRDARNKDEIGMMLWAFDGILDHIKYMAGELRLLADSDISGHVRALSDEDDIGIALMKVQASLNASFGEVGAISRDVRYGAKQIADGAQTLSQGAVAQAASVEELSSAISEIAEKTRINAQQARKTAAMSNEIRDDAKRGTGQMESMMTAVREINEASNNISRVIKVIDDIAFQTNILALNAAVEAARAGEHGKGFAVVAEEVRNLAAKSAEAADSTGELIERSIEKASLGASIAEETSSSLTRIVEGVGRSTEAINEIAYSFEKQSAAISEVNTGIEQVAQIIQQNSAYAQESAATSQELSGQSELLAKQVSQFKLRKK